MMPFFVIDMKEDTKNKIRIETEEEIKNWKNI
jgi:hypothetical protein